MMEDDPRKCLVWGCTNTGDAGRFVDVGDLCAPCYNMLTTGLVLRHGKTFIHTMKKRLEELDPADESWL